MRTSFLDIRQFSPVLSEKSTVTVALADDHALIRNGLAGLINSFDGYRVIFQAGNGQDCIDALKPGIIPDLVLMDINMPKKDGYDTTLWFKQHYPDIRVLALSMYDNENAIIRMLKCGARGYILKDAEPADLKRAMDDIMQKGFYYSDLVTGHLIHTMQKFELGHDNKSSISLSDRETHFLQLICSEFTYKEIADKMFVSPRTVDGYRDALFEKLQIKTRVGLVIYAIKNNIVDLNKKE